MKIIIRVLKAILIGLGGILPGVSGGMIAASFGIYEELISALNDVTKTPFKAIFSIWEYLLGIILGVLLGIVLIATIFAKYPIAITFLFIGLILGGIPDITSKIKKDELKIKHYIGSIIMVSIMIGLLFLKQVTTSNLNYFIYILAGFLIALSLIVPGLSGTMILLALGVYIPIMDIIKDFINYLVRFDLTNVFSLFLPVLAIGLSGLLSLVILAKPINYLLKKKSNYFYMAVLGILLVSPFNIVFSLYKDETYGDSFNNIGVITIIVSIILFILGLVLAYVLTKASNSRKEELYVE